MNTPRTDAMLYRIPIRSDQGLPTGDYHEVVDSHDARQLEREADTLKAENERLYQLVSDAALVFRLQAIRDNADKKTADGWRSLEERFRTALGSKT